MKKVISTIILSALLCSLYSQTIIKKIIVRDHSTNPTSIYSRTIIENLKQHQNDGKFELATRQGGIIGNDFLKYEEIGKVAAKNSSGNVTDYIPIDGFKRTFCGRETGSEYASDDGDFNVVYAIGLNNPLLQLNFKRLNEGNSWYEWNHFKGEVKYDPGFERFYPASQPDIQFRPFGCIYGAWVKEWAGDWNPSDHKDNNEVHPIEQGWSIQQEYLGKNRRKYDLFLAIDNSGKFESVSDYHGIPKKLWSLDTLNGVFGFAFEINRSQKEKLNVNIKSIISNNVTIQNDDGNKHFLIFQNDTLVKINEVANAELMNINFFNVGYKSSDINVIRGFFIINTRLGKITIPRTHSGNIKLEVIYEKQSEIKQQIKITLLKIKRLENNSFRYYDSSENKLFTDPAIVPNGFKEKSVNIVFKQSGSAPKSVFIQTLEKGQVFNFTDFSFFWEGKLTDQYFSEVVCRQNESSNSIRLGETGIGGFPTRSITDSKLLTMLDFPKPDSQSLNKRRNDNGGVTEQTYTNVNTSLFEITYKVELLASKKNNINPN